MGDIHQGFTHAHKDEVDLVCFVGAVCVERDGDLLNDFGRSQIPSETQRCRRTKRAVHGTADLTRHAKRHARGFDIARHVDRLDARAVLKFIDDARRSVRCLEGLRNVKA